MKANKNNTYNPRSPHPMDIYAGERLRARRLLLNMSQTDLGDKAGVTFQQIQKYETGSNRMSASRVYELAKVLDVPISYFFDGFTESKKNRYDRAAAGQSRVTGEDSGDMMNRRETIKLVRAFYNIEDLALRSQLLKMTRTIARSAD